MDGMIYFDNGGAVTNAETSVDNLDRQFAARGGAAITDAVVVAQFLDELL